MSNNRLMQDKDFLEERLELAKNRIKEIEGEHMNKYAPYFEHVAKHLLRCIDILNDKPSLSEIENSCIVELTGNNISLYSDIIEYDTSYLNPDVTSKLFSDKLGGQYAFLYNELMALIPWSFDGRIDLVTIYVELFLEMYGVYVDELCTDSPDIDKAKHRNNECIYWFYHDYCDIFTLKSVESILDDSDNVIHDIVMNADLSSTNYLYAYGVNISDNDIEFAEYTNSLPDEDIDDIANCYVNGFIKGFEMSGKDISKKSIVKIEFPIGFERVARRSAKLFEDNNLKPVFARDGVFSFDGGAKSRGTYLSSMNKQWIYDHKNDKGYYFDKRFYNRRLEALEEAFKMYKDKAAVFAGPAVIETFGEKEFKPVNKDSAYQFTDKQNKWNVEYMSKAGAINNEYLPRDEYSFTIIAFPIPEIGDEEFFKTIFDKTMELNTLDYDKYLRMQQLIIDILDKAKCVRILGQGGNKTDITVNLHKLDNPNKQTNFENCVADVNIPVGEVFTSPVLKGTNGTLNVSRVFLNGLAYNDLTIEVKDGMVVDYTCSNFDDDKESKRMIFENVLYRHETLPIGEFAIGTNTLAYKMGREYNIEAKLPILIAEKTGPHFAFGDTCYSHEEENKTYNPDGKEIIARENECSALRNEDISKAYFNCHTDITLPFEELGLIEAVLEYGDTVPIIKDGLFVVDGCEELNKPLM
ncbi:MAG: aminopeptidase [Lachnospiraceae bacterium]|nr:aminopeptidase [Lachnospiraceae bacterium]